MDIILGQAYSFLQRGQRDNQEDARWPDCDSPDTGQRFFVVCDGVGGSEKGEEASATVCHAFAKALGGYDFTRNFTNADFSHALDKAYDALDQKAKQGQRDMATTLTFAAFHAGGAMLVHIGDSRIYQIRPSQGIIYRSDDHSLVNQMVHSGIITPEEAETHPQRNVITRCMEPVSEDQSRCMATAMRTTDVKAGDYFLLCTDGVLHQVSDAQLVELLVQDVPDEQKIRELATKSENSSDNNTAYLIPVLAVEGVSTVKYTESNTSSDTHRMTSTQSIEEIESIPDSEKDGVLTRFFKIFTGK